jgi:hypothetical protein
MLMCSHWSGQEASYLALLLLHISDFWPWLVTLFALIPILKLYNLVPNANAAIVGKQFVNIKAVATQYIMNLRTTLKERGIHYLHVHPVSSLVPHVCMYGQVNEDCSFLF